MRDRESRFGNRVWRDAAAQVCGGAFVSPLRGSCSLGTGFPGAYAPGYDRSPSGRNDNAPTTTPAGPDSQAIPLSPRRGRQRLAPGVSPGTASPTKPSPAGATQALLCVLALLLAACNQPPKSNGEIDIKPDIIRPSEAQSNFLDIGTQAGIEWLSFVPNDQNEYPDFYTGLDSDQKRRLRVAPLEEPDNRALIGFDLPPVTGKLWPVDWYATELMAVEVHEAKNISIALARPTKNGRQLTATDIAKALAWQREGGPPADSNVRVSGAIATSAPVAGKDGRYVYGAMALTGKAVNWFVVAEVLSRDKKLADEIPYFDEAGALSVVLNGISIKRELALEGLPKHKCGSSLDELKQGKLVFPGGTLNLPLKDGYIARKTGGDSTIQVDGEGAKPWLLIRRLKEDDAPGDLRVRVRNDATFSRRTGKNPKGFGVGRRPDGAKVDAVVWDYSETAAEQQLVGVIAVGNELLSIEVVSRGLTDGDARRAARDKALALISGATGTEAKGDPLQVLEGWNVGTMGK